MSTPTPTFSPPSLKCGDHQGGSSEELGGSLNEMPDGKIRYFGRHIDALARYEELREAIEDWSNQRRGGIDIKT
jgi:hypothetical protein